MKISIKDIELRIAYLNRLTGSPETYSIKDTGTFKSNIGHYHLNQAYGGCALHRLCNEGGGVQDISRIGYASRKDLYNWINAFISGIEASKLEVTA